MGSGEHGEYSASQRSVFSSIQVAPCLLRSAQGSLCVGSVQGQVSSTGPDLSGQGGVLSSLSQVQGALEVSSSQLVMPGVVGHPAGHLGQSCCGDECSGAAVLRQQGGADS